ncbi:TIGR03750 family conjugal transfer protein [Pasteurella multocida]
MKEHYSQTITFLPDRLNRRPTVYRGMTASELIIVMISGLLIGICIGLIVMLLFGFAWPVIPSVMFLVTAFFIRFGGSYISRLKRGKPDSWLERYIEFKRNPSQFILENRHWSIKRTKKAK